MNANRRLPFTAALALVLALGLPQVLFAFPGPALPLYLLWKRSDLIAYGDVISSTTDGPQQRASVSVAKILKGDTTTENSVLTVFTRLGGCPYPHSFKANERVLLFLTFDPEELMFTPVGASEGVINTDASGLGHYAPLLDELPAIYKLTDEQSMRERLLRWSVRCSLDPVSRQQGLQSLASIMPRDTAIGQWLLPEEADRLIDVVESESDGKQTVGIVELMIKHPDPRIDNVLLTSLTRCNDETWRSMASVALQELPERRSISLPEDLHVRLEQYWERESEFYWGGQKHSKREKRVLKSALDTEFGWLCANVWHELASDGQVRAKQ